MALQYQPGEKATKPWRICALFPHMKDTIWLAVNYGIVEEARRQGVAVTIYQAGGYENLPRQLSPVRRLHGRWLRRARGGCHLRGGPGQEIPRGREGRQQAGHRGAEPGGQRHPRRPRSSPTTW